MSAAARKSVSDAAKKLAYRPSSIARSLSTRSLGIIGVLAPELGGRYAGVGMHVAAREVRRAGRHIAIASGRDPDGAWDEREGFEFLLGRDCDGVLVIYTELTDRALIEMHARFPNLAIINRITPGLEESCFSIDHRAAGALAARHLLALGHRRIAAVTGPLTVRDARDRHEGFAQTLAEAGAPLDPALTAHGDYHPQSGAAATRTLLAGGQAFSALFCGNDLMATAALSTLHAEAPRRRVAVIGYDDTEMCAFLSPSLTSVSVAQEAVVENACRHLLNVCYGLDLPVTREFRPQVMARASTWRLAEAA